MEWTEKNLDDALFSSMLSPVVKKAFESLFFLSERTAPSLAAVLVFHRELGLVLHSDTTRRLLPKANFGSAWNDIAKTIEEALPPPVRSSFRTSLGASPVFHGAYPLLPDRIEEWEGVFLWSASFDWGWVLALRVSSLDEATFCDEDFSTRADSSERSLRPLLDRWMQDATLEVFWSRIMTNIGIEFQPLPGNLSPEWIRTVAISGSEEARIFWGDYVNTPGRGWQRHAKLLPPGKTPARQRRSGVGEAGKTLDVPVDLWGMQSLGTVHIPVALLRKIDSRDFLMRVRDARSLALRSLYRHLIYPGPLAFLLRWNPEAESFDLALLKELPTYAGREVLGNAVMTVRLESRGLAASLERTVRPGDMMFSGGAGSASRTLFLPGCDPELARSSVLPRILRIEGIEERHMGKIVSLSEYLSEGSARK